MDRDNLKNYTLMMFAMLFWGASFVFIKIVYKYTGPITLIFSRLVIASVILISIYLLNNKRERIESKDLLTFLLLGFTEPFLYFIGEGYGMQYVSSTHASVIIATIPVFAMLASIVFYHEKISKRNIGGVLVSFLGIIVMIGREVLSEKGSLLGIFLMFFAVSAAVANSLLIFKLGNKYSSLTIITMQNIVGATLFLPLFFLLEANNFSFQILNKELVLSVLFLAIFPSVLSFVFYISVLKKIGVTKTSVFSNMIPIVTGVISFIMLGSRFQIREILGIAVVIIGLYLTQTENDHTEVIPYEG